LAVAFFLAGAFLAAVFFAAVLALGIKNLLGYFNLR
jgi:hypothetical protein